MEYQGVSLVELLQRGGQSLGDQLHGKGLNQYLVAKGADGFTVVIALPELDKTVFLVADTINGKPLPDGEGKLRLIVGDTSRRGRWVKGLCSIRLQRVADEKN